MEGGPLSTKKFAKLAERAVPFCHITTYVDSDPHQDLMAELGGSGWPYVAFLDVGGELLVQQARPFSVERFELSLDAVLVLQVNAVKAEAGDPAAQLAVLRAELDLEQLSYDEARRSADRLKGKVPDASLDSLEQRLTNLEFSDYFAGLPRGGDREKTIQQAGLKLLAMKQSGRVPDGALAGRFWNLLLAYADQDADPALLVEAATAWKKLLDPDRPRDARTIAQIDEKLAAARAKRK